MTKAREHIHPVLSSLHWLPIKERIDYKVACFIFKCLHHLGPEYLSELIDRYVPPRALRSAGACLLNVPFCKLTLNERSFSVGGPKVWNSLSANTRALTELSIFKTALKTELFRRAFD